MEELQLNHTYLFKYRFEDSLYSATILVITGKAYHIRWNTGMNSSQTWEDKEVFHNKYKVVEDISDFTQNTEKFNPEELHKNYNQKFLEVKTEWVMCHVCKGFGTVYDPNSSVMSKTCPLCNGSKQIPKVTQIEQK